MSTLVDVRPPALDVLFRPGNTLTLTANWPAGELAGRTFSAELNGTALTTPVDVTGDVMTVVVTDTETGALAVGVPVDFELLEDIGGTDEPVIVGLWTPSNDSAATSSTTIEVSTGGATIELTVAGIGGSVGDLVVAGDLTLGGSIAGDLAATGRAAFVTDDLAIDAFLAFDDPILSVGHGATFTITAGSSYQGVLYDPTIVYDVDSAFTGGRIFESSPTLRNLAGIANDIPHITDYYVNTHVVADGAALSFDGSAFLDALDLSVVNGGTLTATRRASHESAMSIGAGVDVPTRRGYRFVDATGAGTLDDQIAIDVEALTKGSTNIGIRNASTEVFPIDAQTIDSPTDQILPRARVIRLSMSGGSHVLTSTPHIPDGEDGQVITLIGGTAQQVTITDEGTLPGSNIQLSAATSRVIGQRDCVELMFVAAESAWIETRAMGLA